MKGALAELARRRLRSLPSPPAPAELQQAKVAFFEALVNRDQRAARDASAVMARYSRPERRLSPAEAEKRAPRMRFLVKWLGALRERRDEEARGIVHARPTPEQEAEAKMVMERLTRWMAGDESAGPFE
jgi:hypothetical protein